MKIILGGLFLAIGMSMSIAAETPNNYADGKVGSTAVLPSFGTFILVRKDDTLCAIQFTEMWRGNDATKGSFFNTGEESFRSKYRWVQVQRRDQKWSMDSPVSAGTGDVSRGRLVGLGKFAVGNSNMDIKCGSMKISWSPPAWVYFVYGYKRDVSYEIAQTPWVNVKDIDPNDPNLHWHRYEKEAGEK